MQSRNVIIKGTGKYFFSKPTEEAKVPKTDKQKKEYALNRVYVNGNLFCPSKQIRGTMIGAAQMAKMKIERSMKRTTDLFKTQLLQVVPEEIHFRPHRKLENVLLEKHFISDAGIWSYSAYIEPGWELEFDVSFGEVFEPKFIEEALSNAGLLCGIGGRRPYNGVFEVVRFE